MRSVALEQLGRNGEAKSALAELLTLEPDFAAKERKLIGNYVKVDGLIDKIIEGLQKAGLGDFV